MSFDRKTTQDARRGDRLNASEPGSPGKRTLTDALSNGAPLGLAVAPASRPPSSSPGNASQGVHAAAAHGVSGRASQLPFLDRIQRLFGPHDVGHIRAHTDDAASTGARAMGASAFAMGDHVAFAGSPDLHTAAHEAAHVVQQRAGVQLKGGVGEAGDRYEQHADAVADLVVQGKSSEALLDSAVGPASGADSTPGSASAVQRQPGADAGSCDIPFPRTQNVGPDGTTTCRRFDGVTTYKDVTEARLIAAGYKFWTSDGSFDKWVRVDGSSELWVQLPKINAATSEKAIGQLRSVVATRKGQLDELTNLGKLMNSDDPDVAAAARDEWQQRMDEFPGFDDDYALVPALRQQVDSDHRAAFEAQVTQLMEQRDRYDPQSERP